MQETEINWNVSSANNETWPEKNELPEKDSILWLNHCYVSVLEYIKYLYGYKTSSFICSVIRKVQHQPVSHGADCREVTLAVATDTQIKLEFVRGSLEDPNLPGCLTFISYFFVMWLNLNLNSV